MIYRVYINSENIKIRKKENSKLVVMKIKTSPRIITRKESVQCRSIIPIMNKDSGTVLIITSYTNKDVRSTRIRREVFFGLN